MVLFSILYWGIAYSTGLLCLGLYGAIYYKKRDITDLNVIIFNLNITVIVVCLSLLSIIPEKQVELLNNIGQITFLASALLIYTLPRFSHSIKMSKNRKKLDLLFLIFSIICIVIVLITKSNLVLWFMGVAIAYSMVYMIFPYNKSYKKNKGHRHNNILGIFTLILLPLFFIVDFFPYLFNIPTEVSDSVIIFPGFYLLLNIGLISALKGSFWTHEIDYTVFLNKYGITAREAEVLKLLVKGDSYKVIADKLTISLSTVKTHISKLYNKTETSNKLEIIKLLGK